MSKGLLCYRTQCILLPVRPVLRSKHPRIVVAELIGRKHFLSPSPTIKTLKNNKCPASWTTKCYVSNYVFITSQNLLI